MTRTDNWSEASEASQAYIDKLRQTIQTVYYRLPRSDFLSGL